METPAHDARAVAVALFFFFQAEDGIRDLTVTGVQTCALPIFFTIPHLPLFEGSPEGTNVNPYYLYRWLIVLTLLSLLGLSGSAFAAGCGAPANLIEAENCLPGNPQTEWDIIGAGDSTIQGFATDMSYN